MVIYAATIITVRLSIFPCYSSCEILVKYEFILTVQLIPFIRFTYYEDISLIRTNYGKANRNICNTLNSSLFIVIK